MKNWSLDLGANLLPGKKTSFKVWAPLQESLQIKIFNESFPVPIAMHKDNKGYFHAEAQGLKEGDTYAYVMTNGDERADPVSRFLPKGGNGPTMIVDPKSFKWADHKWKCLELEDMVFYECHVGTFTDNPTFLGIIEKLPYLKGLGINALQLMPIIQFPGRWGWGYDGISFFPPHNTYGTPDEFKQLINACHQEGIAVFLDLVYNHLGPENCFLEEFGPYTSSLYMTDWGKPLNFDRAYSDEVRHFFIQNFLYWIIEYHIDGFRLDAVDTLYDFSATHFLQKLSTAVERIAKDLDRKVFLVGETSLNDSKVIQPAKKNGDGLHALWSEDYHHALHVSLTREKQGYYHDYHPLLDLKKVLTHGVLFEGKYSEYFKRSRGNSFKSIPLQRFVAFSQNHDQVGNRPHSNRLSSQISYSAQKMSAIFVTLTPFMPLLFMGQEYGETAPFEFFVDYEDKSLMDKVYEGRRKTAFLSSGEVIYPDERALNRSKLRWDLDDPLKEGLLKLHKELISLRKKTSFFKNLKRKQIKTYYSSKEKWVACEYKTDEGYLSFFCSFNEEKLEVKLPFSKECQLLLHTEQKEFAGTKEIHFDPSKQTLKLDGECGCIFTSL